MDTTRSSFDEKTRLFGSTSWQTIASGVFIALALQILLSLLGLALALGDGRIGGGYESWAIFVQVISIAVGAALAARLSHLGSRAGGMVAGIMIWAVALVLGGAVPGSTMVPRASEGSVWVAFFGAMFSLGAAILGGWLGATIRGRSIGSGPAHRQETPAHAVM